MKFTSIELHDIFAYRGRSEIDLSACTDERNIIIVQGANGAGKTSLLNAIKLLFLGAGDERFRRSVIGQSQNARHFVNGDTGRWYGVFNNHARQESAPARVALSWEHDGRVYRAERSFWPTRTSPFYREQLTVTIDRRDLDGAAALAALHQLLPKEVVPFFFFDGEQIQSLADAEVGREQAEIERLLGLSFVSSLTHEIEGYANERRKAGLPESIQKDIAEAEGQEQVALAVIDVAERLRVELEEDLQSLGKRKAAVEQERNHLRGGLSEDERRRMESRIDVISERRERLAASIAESLPVQAPALTNLALANRAFAMLEEQLGGTADASLAEKLHRKMPEDLISSLKVITPPVDLSSAQARQYREQVALLLTKAGVPANAHENPLLSSLSPRQVRVLRDQFHLWTGAGVELAAGHAAMLREMRSLSHEERSLRRDLHDAEITTDEARRAFAALTAELQSIDEAMLEKVAESTEQRAKEDQARRQVAQHRDAIARLYAQHEQVIRENRAFQLARKAKLALETYREERRKLIRASVQARLNSHIRLLLGSDLIAEVQLNDKFAISYLDHQGEPVARYSLSAGMRQLAAMAMLWALKDEARRPLPVMIDTPLGRIDRENRGNLMRAYFPEAGNPLILLPTNTELTADDYALLGDRVAGRYRIENPDKMSAHLVSMSSTANPTGH